MSNCTHCGKPAGLLRNFHPECRAQFERATTTIPAFFEKLLQSLLPADRFEQLLKEVAVTFHIRPEQLRALSIDGINAMVNAALAHRLPSTAEEDRILEIATTLGFTADDIPGLSERLVKIGVLRDLDDGIIPERVSVVGPMPFELDAAESIIWIFNNVTALRAPKQKEAADRAVSATRPGVPDYVAPASLEGSARGKDAVEVGTGDLMVTSRHVFIVSDDRHRQLPFAKLAHIGAFSDGFELARSRDDRPLTFLVDDAWFAANLMIRLMRLPANAPAPEREPGPAGAK
jgi:hypothetical protein